MGALISCCSDRQPLTGSSALASEAGLETRRRRHTCTAAAAGRMPELMTPSVSLHNNTNCMKVVQEMLAGIARLQHEGGKEAPRKTRRRQQSGGGKGRRRHEGAATDRACCLYP
jgi:hypothetical protein